MTILKLLANHGNISLACKYYKLCLTLNIWFVFENLDYSSHLILTYLFPSREQESEIDGVQPQPESFSLNAARRIHIKKNSKKHVDDPEREARTLFVGNIPYAQANKKKLIKLFSNYGDVESVRFRCAPLKDPRMSKKVCHFCLKVCHTCTVNPSICLMHFPNF